MPTLFDSMGRRYVNEFYSDALFMHEGHVYTFGGWVSDEDLVSVKKLVNGRWVRATLSPSVFTDMSTFAWPRLGYRDVTHPSAGGLTYYVTTTRTAQRGLRHRYIHYDPLPVVGLLNQYYSPQEYADTPTLTGILFNPKFTSFNDGLEKLRAGLSPSFAISEDLAIGLSPFTGQDVFADIYFKGNVVGKVLEDNTVVVPSKILRKSGKLHLLGDST